MQITKPEREHVHVSRMNDEHIRQFMLSNAKEKQSETTRPTFSTFIMIQYLTFTFDISR